MIRGMVMKNEYLIDFDGVILNSQDKFLEVMGDNIDPNDWLKYLHSINWYLFLRECEEIDESISTLNKLQKLKKIKGIITKIHSISEGEEKSIYLRERDIIVPIFYVLPHQKKSEVFIPQKKHILIDDSKSNCKDWTNDGGTSLLFDAKLTHKEKGKIKSLKDLL